MDDSNRLMALDGMPVLEEYCQRLDGHFDGVNILYINHLISDSLMVARAFCRCGAKLWIVTVPYGDTQSVQRQSIIAGMRELGPTIVPEISEPLDFASTMRASVRQQLTAIIQASRDAQQSFMIVEDGGYAFPLLHDDSELHNGTAHCIGAVEHTSRGLWNYQYMEIDDVGHTPRQLRRPAVSIAASMLKSKHEPPFVAQAVVDELTFLLRKRHEFLRYRDVCVVGCGRVGLALALTLRSQDARVLAIETDSERAEIVRKTNPDLRVQADLDDAAVMQSRLIIGASGQSSFSGRHLQAFLRGPNDWIMLASASSKSIEFSEIMQILDEAAAQQSGSLPGVEPDFAVQRHRAPGFGIDYLFESATQRKRLSVIADGYPAIFYPGHTHGAPNRPMDPIMTELFLAACLLREHSDSLPPTVHSIDMLETLPQSDMPWMDLCDESRILRRWCSHNAIDFNQYAHERGIDTR
jgi:hypothetical protein